MPKSGGSSKSDRGTDAPVKPSNARSALLPKQVSGKNTVQSGSMGSPPSSKLNSTAKNPGYGLGQTRQFDEGWPKNMDHDPRLIAKVWRDGANYPYQVRTADGTFTMPKGMGNKYKSNLTKDKSFTRDYKERERPGAAGFDGSPKPLYAGKGSGSSASGGVKKGK